MTGGDKSTCAVPITGYWAHVEQKVASGLRLAAGTRHPAFSTERADGGPQPNG